MSRYIDIQNNHVLYSDMMLPQEAFYTADTAEFKLVSCIFDIARNVAALKLTETELALYSAAVLLSPGKLIRTSKMKKKIDKKTSPSTYLKSCKIKNNNG